ncbi:hypothetical protein FAGAP_8440 [Fusarium agapanthi]|uniref:HTH myb-type domain-containing protein n=1 Tax=Fusarium agapanthi TaxID=1803897 RepID=A0A9P5B605_9HYPO|nr:hypothetical protein FAGAP_8440 [Fusarium agapanthi]
MTPNHIDNCSPDSYDGEPPATSQPSSMTSSPHELACTDQDTLDECLKLWPSSNGLPVQPQGHHMPQHEDNRHGIPSSVPSDYDGIKHGDQTHAQLVLRQKTVPQLTYDVSGTGHPDVAMMANTVLYQDQLPQQLQRLFIDPQCLAPGTATPVPSPWTPDDLYADGIPGHQRSQHSAYGDFICSGGGPSVDIHDISNPRHGSPQTMDENFQYRSPQMESCPLVPQPFGSLEEGSTAIDEFYSILEPSDHPQYYVPPSGTQRPCPSNSDLPAIGMDELEHSGFSGIQRTSWGATCAPDADVSVRQPQHLSTNNNYLPSSKRPTKKNGCDNGLERAPRVVEKAGMSNPEPRPRMTKKRFTQDEVKLLIGLKKNTAMTWKQIADKVPRHSPHSLRNKHCKIRKRKLADTD